MDGAFRYPYKDMKLHAPNLWINKTKNVFLNQDVFKAREKLLENIIIAYFDSPYGSNNEKMPPPVSASYYHMRNQLHQGRGGCSHNQKFINI
jgi:adenine-specific DNA-methyltransferase